MANNEHWALLRQGLKTVWNKWRVAHPDKIPDLSKVDLHSINLKGADFSRTDLSEANLYHADLTEANLSSVNLLWADLRKAYLCEATLFKGNLREANLSDADLRRTNFTKADLTQANLTQANLSGANLSGADLFKANLSGANLSDADLRGADLRWADLTGANLNGANLKEARISQETAIDEKWRRVWEIFAQGAVNQDLGGIDFSGVNLSGANLSGANLSGTNLSGADLFKVNLSGANLSGANLSGANLKEAQITRETVIEKKWRKLWEIVNQGAVNRDLSGVDLSGVDLKGTNLSGANLSGANLSGANLSRIQALGTNFTGAIFTGACIEGWETNSTTNLENVICDYIYLQQGQQERRPIDINKNFTIGEFTQLFQKIQESAELIFFSGINWQAFFTAFQKLQSECAEELTIQAIENKNDGAFVIRINVPLSTKKVEIENALKCQYKLENKAIEKRYRVELLAQEEEVKTYRQQSTHLTEIIKLLADITASDFEYSRNAGDLTNSPILNTQKIGGGVINTSQQNLVETRVEIQQLLYELAQTDLATNEAVAEAIHQEIRSNSSLKARLQAALKAGGIEAVKAIFHHPLFSIPAETIEGWLEIE